jgi:predicted glycosyltransferase
MFPWQYPNSNTHNLAHAEGFPGTTMNVWIDLDNSPHVQFFAPIIRRLERAGIPHFITVRSFSQTEDLARWYGLDFVTVGKHRTPRHFLTRVGATAERAAQLARYVQKQKPTVAISHGSRAMALAAYLLRIPTMTLYDYEFVSCRFFNMVSTRVLVPQQIPVQRLQEQGLKLGKLVSYPGFKEEVYIHDFKPDHNILNQLKLDPKRVIVALRPPSTWAHYQDPKSEKLLHALMQRLQQQNDIQVVTLTRTEEQAIALRKQYGPVSDRFRISSEAVDGLSLMWYSDAIFSGGGTMVREAALLGLNAYSIFAGKLGAADEALTRMGLLKMIHEQEEIENLEFRKAPERKAPSSATSLTREFVSREIERFIREYSGPGTPALLDLERPTVSSTLSIED